MAYDRIAINPDICNGRPIVRGMRSTVQTVLEFLYAGTSRAEWWHQYPMLEPEDLDACQRLLPLPGRFLIQKIISFGKKQQKP